MVPVPFLLSVGASLRDGRSTVLESPPGDFRRDFARLRAGGGTAEGSARCARILERWRVAESRELVRLRYVWDEDPSSALDFLEQSAEQLGEPNLRDYSASVKRERARAERDGVFGIVGEFRVSTREPWTLADSVWGFIGDDGREVGGYAADAMGETLRALEGATRDACPTCGRPRIGGAT